MKITAVDRLTRTQGAAQGAQNMAYGLGLFSIALGLGELLGARTIRKAIGLSASDALIQGYGAREVLSGLMILTSNEPNKLVWGRVAGDVLDLISLMPALSERNPQRNGAVAATAFVLGATMLDAYVASLRRPAFR